MLLKRFNMSTIIILIICCVIQCELAASYKTEIAITPAPVEETTTKKSGFFGGIKNWFTGSESTTELPGAPTTARAPTNLPVPAAPGLQNAHKPPPLTIPHAPLQPLGPRPDTPVTSPWDPNQKQPPQWPQQPGSPNAQHPQHPQHPQFPQNGPGSPKPNGSPTFGGPQYQPQVPSPGASSTGSTTSTVNPMQPQFPQNVARPGVGQPHISQSQATNNAQNNFPRPNSGQPNLPPGFGNYQPPGHKPQPSGYDLSYGGGVHPHQPAGRPGVQAPSGPIAPMAYSTSTTTQKPAPMNFDLRGGSDVKQPTNQNFPSLPTPKTPAIREDFPALPAPKSPTPPPASTVVPSPPSAWNKPLPTPVAVIPNPSRNVNPTPNAATGPDANGGYGGNGPNGNRVAFVPNNRPTSTMRPGVQGNSASQSLASDADIETLTETLYTKEVNSQLSLITVNQQGKTRSIDSTDEAPQPLLDVNDKVFENPTVAKMRLLFNNYEVDTMANEHVTPNEHKEENDFLDAVMATNVMRQAMLFLQNKGIVGPDPKTHRDMVKELWFTQYSRGSGKIGSSGFEHVFVNEVKNGTIIGLHNWVYFFDEENAGRLDYKGYLKTLDLGNKAKVMKVRFTHNGLNKPVNTLFIGTSPELELALYTVCFKLRADTTCPVSLGNSKFGLVTYSWRYRGKNLIGSAYPEI